MQRYVLGHILTQKIIKALVGALLPTCKGPGEVDRAIERLVNLNVSCKVFAAVIRQRCALAIYCLRPSRIARLTNPDVF